MSPVQVWEEPPIKYLSSDTGIFYYLYIGDTRSLWSLSATPELHSRQLVACGRLISVMPLACLTQFKSGRSHQRKSLKLALGLFLWLNLFSGLNWDIRPGGPVNNPPSAFSRTERAEYTSSILGGATKIINRCKQF